MSSKRPWIFPLLAVVLAAGLYLSFERGKRAVREIHLASTTSTKNSGLFEYLLPKFTDATGIQVHVVAVGTGAALQLGRRGDADALLVHDKPSELKFVQEGYGTKRRDVMYNDFVIVGPESDPAGIAGSHDAVAALKTIREKLAPFVSRGDDSGTNRKEMALWKVAGIDVKSNPGKWYRSAGAGMGATINTAVGMRAYTLTDRATWLAFKNKDGFVVLCEKDPRLFNQYGVILVNPKLHPHVRTQEATVFYDWITGPEGQKAIAGYRIDGRQVFFPNAKGA